MNKNEQTRIQREDYPKARLYRRQNYYIENGFVIPISESQKESYNPFNEYGKEGKRYNKSPHHVFASIDINNKEEIEWFYYNYGPLGLYKKEIRCLANYDPSFSHIFKLPDDSPVVGVQRFSSMLVPMNELVEEWHIPISKLPIPDTNGDYIPVDEVTPNDTWEKHDDFIDECLKFKWIMDLKEAYDKKEIERIKELLKSKPLSYDIEQADAKRIMFSASSYIVYTINSEIEHMVTPLLNWDDNGYGISKNITWRCENLLSSLYMMILLDITRGAYTFKCPKCNKWFDAQRLETTYCSPSCQTSSKEERKRENIELKKKDEVLKLLSEGKSISEVSSLLKVRKKTINEWIINKGGSGDVKR